MKHEQIVSNFQMPSIKIRHSELRLFDPEGSIYKAYCPACEDGLLLVRRDPKKEFQLMASDMCVSCGQRFQYTDIRALRKREQL